jgi:hypothetical protein
VLLKQAINKPSAAGAVCSVHPLNVVVVVMVVVLLLVVSLAAAVAIVATVLVGYDLGRSKRFEWFHATLFAGVIASTIWVIYDLEMPRYGLIRVDDYDRTIREVREGFDRVPKPLHAA